MTLLADLITAVNWVICEYLEGYTLRQAFSRAIERNRIRQAARRALKSD